MLIPKILYIALIPREREIMKYSSSHHLYAPGQKKHSVIISRANKIQYFFAVIKHAEGLRHE